MTTITRPGEAQSAVAAALRVGGWSLDTAHATGSTRTGYTVTGTITDGPETGRFVAHVYPDGHIDDLRIDHDGGTARRHHDPARAARIAADPFDGIAD